MTTDLIKLKALATAAAANQYDPVTLNDYGTAVPPTTVLSLIAEIERHRQVNAEGCKPDLNILPAQTTVSTTHSKIKAAENELIFAQVGLLSAARHAYPVGSRLRIQIGRSATEVVVKGHISAWWSRPGYIQATNPRTGKTRTFPHSAVVEVLP